MKKIISISLALLATLNISAQSQLSSQITDMLSDVDRQISEAQTALSGNGMRITDEQCPVDTAAIQRSMVVSFNADGTVKTVDVIAKLADGATCPTSALIAKGITITGEALGFVFLTVPAEQLEFLETLPEFVRLNANGVNQPNNDNSRSLLNVSNINGIDKTSYTFDTPFTGKGVVVGIIDTGIQYNHVAFKDSEGNSRIKRVVDYGTGGTATVYDTPEQIAALTYGGFGGSKKDDDSHGTHVACSAAGSSVTANVDYPSSNPGTRNLMGMAPDADLVLCGMYDYYDNRAIICMSKIIEKATELGEPCVINMSFGTPEGWHTKTGLSDAIDNATKAGVVVCMSTGNDGLYKWTVDKTLQPNETMVIIPAKTGSVKSSDRDYLKGQTIKFYMPHCTNINDVSFEFEVVDSITGAVSTLSDNPIKKYTNNSTYYPNIDLKIDTSNKNWVKGTMTIPQSYFSENSKFLAIKFTNKSGGEVRIYALSRDGNNIDSFISTDIPNYTYDKGTADMSMNVSCCTENVISVGAYHNMPYNYKGKNYDYKSYEGTLYTYNAAQVGTNNSSAAYSCYGRDDHGNVHPVVIAPGVAIVSAYNKYSEQKAKISENTLTENIGAYLKDNNGNYTDLWYVTNGTSMSAPITTGVVALWMQACRHFQPEHGDLTPADVRDIIKNTSRYSVDGEDITCTAGNTELNRQQLGYGLIDAEAGIKYIKNNFTPTGVAGITSTEEKTAGIVKKFRGNTLVIEKDGKQYNAAGQRIF